MMPSTQLIMTNNNPWLDKDNNKLEIDGKLEKKQFFSKSELQKIAENELRETESSKKQCLSHLREWLKKNKDIENCLEDDNFLLRFLRVRKFSIPMAEQTLLKYLNYRKKFEDFMYNLDYTEKNVLELINDGYIYVSPFRDNRGRRVVISDTTKFDPHKYTGVDLAKAHAVTYETLLDDEENQILGIHHVADFRGTSPSFLTLFSVSDFARIVKWGEQSFPMRHKEIDIVNLPQAVKYIYDFAQTFLSDKLRERFTIHNSNSDLLQKLGKDVLPVELGGKVSAKEMVELWKRELQEKRNRLLSYSKINLLSDQGIMGRRNAPKNDNNGVGGVVGSFRRLEVD